MKSTNTSIQPSRIRILYTEGSVHMKIFIFVLFACCWNIISAQSTIPVSSTGIGELKINMTLADVEKIIGNTIALPVRTEESYGFDSVTVNYKGVKVDMEFYPNMDDANGKPKMMVYSMRASHPSLQTRSGIKQGSDKFDIIKKLDGMYLTLQPDGRMEEKPDKAKYSMLMLMDGENGTQLLMYFENNKLTGFHITIYEGC